MSNLSDRKGSDRRGFLRKIVGLAASAGIVGLLLDRLSDKSVPQPVQADGGTSGGALIIDASGPGSNTGTGTTQLNSSGSPALIAANTGSGAALEGSCTAGTGVLGTTTIGTGVQGTASAATGVALGGFAGDPGAIPIVAQGSSSQNANLQEWRGSTGSALSVVDKNGNFGVGTASPGGVLDVEAGNRLDATSSIVNGHTLANVGVLNSVVQQWAVRFNDASSANRLSAQLLRFTYTRNAGTTGYPTIFDSMLDLVPYINENLPSVLRSLVVEGPTVAAGKTLAEWDGVYIAAPPGSGTVTTKYALIIQPGAGNVGIGTTTPSHLIQLSGGAYSNGSTWNNASSVRWKENIEPLKNGVTILKQLHPVAYNYKKTPAKRTMGFIAEEVGKVLPSVVDWDKAEAGYAEGYDHVAVLALAVQAIKELQEQFKNEKEKLHERIEILERTVKQFAAS
jgi:hypothetical protein